jgi:hypothetical protein
VIAAEVADYIRKNPGKQEDALQLAYILFDMWENELKGLAQKGVEYSEDVFEGIKIFKIAQIELYLKIFSNQKFVGSEVRLESPIIGLNGKPLKGVNAKAFLDSVFYDQDGRLVIRDLKIRNTKNELSHNVYLKYDTQVMLYLWIYHQVKNVYPDEFQILQIFGPNYRKKKEESYKELGERKAREIYGNMDKYWSLSRVAVFENKPENPDSLPVDAFVTYNDIAEFGRHLAKIARAIRDDHSDYMVVPTGMWNDFNTCGGCAYWGICFNNESPIKNPKYSIYEMKSKPNQTEEINDEGD